MTAAGGLHGVVTPIAGLREARGAAGLQSWHPEVTLDEVRRRTGFDFDADGAAPTPFPTAREAAALGALDPDGQFERDASVSVH